MAEPKPTMPRAGRVACATVAYMIIEIVSFAPFAGLHLWKVMHPTSQALPVIIDGLTALLVVAHLFVMGSIVAFATGAGDKGE